MSKRKKKDRMPRFYHSNPDYKSEFERALDAKYAELDSPAGVKRLLRDYHTINERAFDGDYDAVVLLVDLATAWRLGISQQAVYGLNH